MRKQEGRCGDTLMGSSVYAVQSSQTRTRRGQWVDRSAVFGAQIYNAHEKPVYHQITRQP